MLAANVKQQRYDLYNIMCVLIDILIYKIKKKMFSPAPLGSSTREVFNLSLISIVRTVFPSIDAFPFLPPT